MSDDDEVETVDRTESVTRTGTATDASDIKQLIDSAAMDVASQFNKAEADGEVADVDKELTVELTVTDHNFVEADDE